MDEKKVQSLTNYLRSLENIDIVYNNMVDKIDESSLRVMEIYSKDISKIFNKIDMNEKDIVMCAMILGFLLKSYSYRYDIAETLDK
jgi:hypothetical protein